MERQIANKQVREYEAENCKNMHSLAASLSAPCWYWVGPLSASEQTEFFMVQIHEGAGNIPSRF